MITVEFMENAFHRYYEGLHRYAYTILRDNDMAKDAVQHVFLTLWEKREKLSITTSIKAYLYRAVYNYCINLQTRGHRHLPIDEANEQLRHTPAALLTESRELRAQIEEAIGNLPPQCKIAFLKSRVERKTYPVIAGELGISVKTVEAQVSKALKILRNIFNTYKTILYAILACGSFFK